MRRNPKDRLKKYYTGGEVLDYSQSSGQDLANLLGQFMESQSQVSSAPQDNFFSQEIEEEQEVAPIEEVEEPETSMFGDDFLGFNQSLSFGDSDDYPIYDAIQNNSPISQEENRGNQGVNNSVNPLIKPLYDDYNKRFGVENLGIWGDKEHQKRKSDHNTGDAIDLQTKGPRRDIADELIKEAEERGIKYIIHDGRIWSHEKSNQGWRKYNGSDPHTGHIHVSFYRNSNSNNMKKDKKKYAGGGKVMGAIGSGISQLTPVVMDLINTINTSYSTQPVMSQRQTAALNPYSKDFGSNNLPTFAMGGQVPNNIPIEAEGQEMIQTPNGQVGEIQGPSHEQGGVDLNVPEGSMIYSDRISIDGKSIAERKKAREKAMSRLMKLAEKNPNDKLLQNTIERTQAINIAEEQKDLMVQEAASDNYPKKKVFKEGGLVIDNPIFTIPPMEETKSLANQLVGYGVTPPNLEPPPIGYPTLNVPTGYVSNILTSDMYSESLPQEDIKIDNNKELGLGDSITMSDYKISPYEYDYIDRVIPESVNKGYNTNPNLNSDKEKTNVSDPTAGDYVGMVGNLFNAFAPFLNTIEQRAGDKPNENFFRNFGKDALAANERSKTYVAGQRERALEDLRSQYNAAKSANRDRASSVNSIRAMDLATDLGAAKGRNSIYDAFSQQMMGLLGQQSQLENQQDQMVMQGETARDLADRQDRDNFYSQHAQDLVNMGTNIQGFGKNLNTSQSNRDMSSLISQLSKYGLGFIRDENGNMVLSKIQ